MSEFSPLRDPVFLLTWQVHLSVVILFALLGIWAGMTRRPWYVAPTLLLALLWLFVPLEAPEPAVVLLLTVPVLAVACRVARPWLEKRAEASSETSQPRWRFSLADLLWLTLIVGMTTALLMQLWRMPWKNWWGDKLVIHWPDVTLSAACFCVVGVTVLAAHCQRTRWQRVCGMVAVMIVTLLSASAHSAIVTKDWLLIVDWQTRVPDSKALFRLASSPKLADLFFVYLFSFLEFALVLHLGLNWVVRRAPASARLEILSKLTAAVLFLAITLSLAIVFAEMQNPPRWPAERFPMRNDRDLLLSILSRHDQLNHKGISPDELRANGNDASATAVDELFKEADELLRDREVTWFDSRYDNADSAAIPKCLQNCQLVRYLGRALGAQASADWAAGRRGEAVEHNLICLRLGLAGQSRGTALEALVGNAVEGIAIENLAKIRTELTRSEILRLGPQLQHLAASRESSELLLARDAAFVERANGWRARLWFVAHRLLNVPLEHEAAVAFACQQRDVKVALLQTDLAVRSYQQTHGKLPENLAALVPEQLASVPNDPFSQQPLVYRREGDGFVLYSLGRDGVDDGGKVGSTSKLFRSGFDIDLDTWQREYDG